MNRYIRILVDKVMNLPIAKITAWSLPFGMLLGAIVLILLFGSKDIVGLCLNPCSFFAGRMLGVWRFHQRDQAIGALLTFPSIWEAAKSLGVDDSTMRRWMKNPAFLDRYRKARRQCVEGAIARVQALTSKAVACLEKNLTCGKPVLLLRGVLG